jgi:long-chain fatty acid transport protein
MFARRMACSTKLALSLLVLISAALPARAQMGILLTGAGPVNRSMGGATVGAPIDASGTLYWNPGAMSALPSSSMDFGVELLAPQTRLSSSIMGFGSGSDRGDDGVFAIPSMALVYKPDDSAFTYGLGVFTIGGFGTNYPGSTTNPILTPQVPLPKMGGLGSIYSDLAVLQLTPNISYQVTDRLSIGGGPTLTMASLAADPLFLTAPTNGIYPAGTHNQLNWGGGFQVGAYYKLDDGWSVGASVKSPQWMDSFHFDTVNVLGVPHEAAFRFNIPMIVSLGVGYTGFDRWTLAADVRYVDYHNADGFDQGGFTSTGAVAGLGWRSIFALSLGAQYQMTDHFSVRMGYSYNQDPISDSQTSFNVASSTILEHAIYCGFSYQVSDALSLSLAYAHAFQNSISGPLVTPAGAVPGSSVGLTTSADLLVLGLTVKFGCHGN